MRWPTLHLCRHMADLWRLLRAGFPSERMLRLAAAAAATLRSDRGRSGRILPIGWEAAGVRLCKKQPAASPRYAMESRGPATHRGEIGALRLVPSANGDRARGAGSRVLVGGGST